MLPITYAPQDTDSTDWSLKKVNGLLFDAMGRPDINAPGAPAGFVLLPPTLTPGTPAIITQDGVALAPNTRKSFIIQNLAAAAVYVKLGTGASSSSFDFELPAGTGANDGTSPPVKIDGYSGTVSIAAASSTPRVNVNQYT